MKALLRKFYIWLFDLKMTITAGDVGRIGPVVFTPEAGAFDFAVTVEMRVNVGTGILVIRRDVEVERQGNSTVLIGAGATRYTEE